MTSQGLEAKRRKCNLPKIWGMNKRLLISMVQNNACIWFIATVRYVKLVRLWQNYIHLSFKECGSYHK